MTNDQCLSMGLYIERWEWCSVASRISDITKLILMHNLSCWCERHVFCADQLWTVVFLSDVYLLVYVSRTISKRSQDSFLKCTAGSVCPRFCPHPQTCGLLVHVALSYCWLFIKIHTSMYTHTFWHTFWHIAIYMRTVFSCSSSVWEAAWRAH
jgi:hypothetical protein